MLKLTRKVEYALISLRHMQGKSTNSISSTKEIANHYNIPVEILAKTLQHMAKENIIEAINGPRGGYRIKAKLNKINLVEFFEKVEGPLGLSDCFYDANCMQIEFCNIRSPIERINNSMINMFRNMSVQDITN
ncbi:MAG: Rrf2 family transcriptional regulator [Candidatus Marinimicrobia bacterium]|jgi:Rrf2 family protein|nr:Rrf2 family transcriptional regulator [Candidatus Neomarinimicrobiota bacterium]